MSSKSKIKKVATKAKKAAANLEKKEIANIALIAGLGIGLFYISRKLGIFKKSEEKETEQVTKTDILKEQRKGNLPSFSDTQYKNFAGTIRQALNCGVFVCVDGTDEEKIYKVLRNLKNNTDWLKLQEAFGFQRIEFTLQKGGLIENLNADMSSKQLKEVNKILSERGITYSV
jgi:hypothetical protein